MYRLQHKYFWLIISMLLLAIVAYLSLAPLSNISKININDKLIHLIVYACLTIWFIGFVKPTNYWLLAIFLIFFSYCMEELQGLTQWRQFEWFDLIANGLGILIGLFLGWRFFSGWAQSIEKYKK